MKAILNRLINHEQLSKEESRQMIINIADGQYTSSQIASFLTVYLMRSITLDELKTNYWSKDESVHINNIIDGENQS